MNRKYTHISTMLENSNNWQIKLTVKWSGFAEYIMIMSR